MESLTARQQEILDFIRQMLESEGFPPTLAEIADAIGVRSVNGVRDHLKALARKGVVELTPGVSRGIRLLQWREEESGLPVVGRVAAGYPILAVENIEYRCQIDPALFRQQADYLLRVEGESMCNAGILDGDLIAIKQTTDVRTGNIVVARVDDEVTVKRLRIDKHLAYLEPANPDFDVIRVDMKRKSLNIEGLVVGLIRDRVGFQSL